MNGCAESIVIMADYPVPECHHSQIFRDDGRGGARFRDTSELDADFMDILLVELSEVEFELGFNDAARDIDFLRQTDRDGRVLDRGKWVAKSRQHQERGLEPSKV